MSEQLELARKVVANLKRLRAEIERERDKFPEPFLILVKAILKAQREEIVLMQVELEIAPDADPEVFAEVNAMVEHIDVIIALIDGDDPLPPVV